MTREDAEVAETAARLRSVMCDVAAASIDLDAYADELAAEVVRMKKAARANVAKPDLDEAQLQRVREMMALARDERAFRRGQ